MSRAIPLLAVLLLCVSTAWPQDLFEEDLGGDLKLELAELTEEESDIDLVGVSHLSEVDTWDGVRPVPRRGNAPEGEFNWTTHEERGYDHLLSFCSRIRRTASPLNDKPITSTIVVPETGAYRVWLCYLATPERPAPVTLGMGPHSFTYADKALSGTETGKTQEAALPIRFETESERLGMPHGPTFVWESRDADLAAGELTVSLRSSATEARVDALFVTRSKSFRPSKAMLHTENTLGKTYIRYRVAAAGRAGEIRLSENLTYHWRHHIHGDKEPRWYWHLESEIGGGSGFAGAGNAPLTVSEWSRWLDASGAMLSGGAYATEVVQCSGAGGNLSFEAQMAWYPHEAAVVKTLPVPVAPGAARGTLMLPLYHPRVPLPESWGMRDETWLSGFRSAVQVAEAQQAVVDGLNLPDGALPHELTFSTGCRPDPAAVPATAKMLRSMGASHIDVSRDLQLELGLTPQAFTYHNDLMFYTNTHCPLDPLARGNLNELFRKVAEQHAKQGWPAEEITLAKFGDEIGAIRPAVHINRCSDCRVGFLAYLGKQFGGPEYFGEADWDNVEFGTNPGANSLEARRLHYACSRFVFDYTADFYRMATEEARKHLPNCRTYCNFSPHPVIMGGTMNGSDWFNLTRRGGTNYAWGEDWASNSSWGFWMGMQIVSYYAAWVECAARGTGHGGGFYAVGAGAHQQLSCVAHGLDTIVLYSFGPQYAGAEASNFWSEQYNRYGDIAAGLHALGPADAIIARGKREPAGAAVLYNRDHEIWHADLGKTTQVDRVGVFVALEHANVPAAIVIEEDLLDPAQIPWPVVYINGHNLSRELVASLRQYVENGGTVVATAGAGSRDRFDGRENGIASLLGTTPEVVGMSEGRDSPLDFEKHKPIDQLTIDARTLPVIGLKARLNGAEGEGKEVLGRFADGQAAAIRHRLGDGEVIVWGATPGIIYRGTAPRTRPDREGLYTHYSAETAALIAAPVHTKWSRGHAYGNPFVETRRWDHNGDCAVTLNNFTYAPVPPCELRIRWPADRPVGSVVASLAGPLEYSRNGDWIITRVAVQGPVDVVVVRGGAD